jgi:hypothetical protein
MAEFLVDKRSFEKRPYEVDFGEILGDTDTQLDQVKTVAQVIDSSGKDVTGTIVQKLIFNLMKVTLILKDGLDGEDYTIFVRGFGNNESDNVQPVRVIELRVRDTLVGNL